MASFCFYTKTAEEYRIFYENQRTLKTSGKIRAKPSLGEGACIFLKKWLILEKKFFLRHLERGLYGIQEGFECVPRDASLCRHALLRHAGARRRHNGGARNRRQPPRRDKPAHLAAGNMQRTCA